MHIRTHLAVLAGALVAATALIPAAADPGIHADGSGVHLSSPWAFDTQNPVQYKTTGGATATTVSYHHDGNTSLPWEALGVTIADECVTWVQVPGHGKPWTGKAGNCAEPTPEPSPTPSEAPTPELTTEPTPATPSPVPTVTATETIPGPTATTTATVTASPAPAPTVTTTATVTAIPAPADECALGDPSESRMCETVRDVPLPAESPSAPSTQTALPAAPAKPGLPKAGN